MDLLKEYWIKWLCGIIAAALAGAWAWLLNRLKRYQNEQKHLQIGVVSLLHDRLFQSCTYYLNRGYANADDRENLEQLYNAYHELGGNGTGTDIYNRVRQLPFSK